eukprot:8681215-Pyramimonas_sp.AAC.1
MPGCTRLRFQVPSDRLSARLARPLSVPRRTRSILAAARRVRSGMPSYRRLLESKNRSITILGYF